jgi:hypothetical protein
MLLVKHPKFNKVMSREAHWLRDEVLGMCIKHGTVNIKHNEFAYKIIQQYSPIPWERAVLYVENKKAFQAVSRRTSSAYHTKKSKLGVSKPGWEKGSVSGNRYKHVDWLEIARFDFDHDWWIDSVDFQRYGGILPVNFDKIRDEFTKMYGLFTNWLITDFSMKALRHIFDINNKYSVDFVKKCMDLVEDKSKRSVEYLIPIMDKEFTLAHNELMERKELHDQSKNILNSILETVGDKRKPVNWDILDETVEADTENAKIFNKVKLS